MRHLFINCFLVISSTRNNEFRTKYTCEIIRNQSEGVGK